MANDCSIPAYLQTFNQSYSNCIREHPTQHAIDEGLSCVAQAVFDTHSKLKACRQQGPGDLDCSPAGYIKQASSALPTPPDPIETAEQQVLKTIENAAVSAAGCVAGALIGGGGGAFIGYRAAGVPGSVINGTIAAAQGCKRGSELAARANEIRRGIIATGGYIQTGRNVLNALSKHSQACRAPATILGNREIPPRDDDQRNQAELIRQTTSETAQSTQRTPTPSAPLQISSASATTPNTTRESNLDHVATDDELSNTLQPQPTSIGPSENNTRCVIQPNLQRPENSSLSFSVPTSQTTTMNATVAPSNPTHSSITLSHSEGGNSHGLNIPVCSPQNSSYSFQTPLGSHATIGARMNPKSPLESEIQGSITVPIKGVPVTFSANVTISRPEDVLLSASIPTFGLDRVLPCLPSEITAVSLNMRKARKRLKKTGKKIARKMGFGKKKRKRRKNKLKKPKAPKTLPSPPKDSLHEFYREAEKLLDTLATFPRLENTVDTLTRLLDELTGLIEQVEERLQGKRSLDGILETMLAQSSELNEIVNILDTNTERFCEAVTSSTQALEETQQDVQGLLKTGQELATRTDEVANWLKENMDRSILNQALQMLDRV